MSTALRSRRRVSVRVEGVVQGVGFRPFVHRLAGDLDLGGFILNDGRGVLIEVEGDPRAVERFLVRLPAEAPPLARLERIAPDRVAPRGAERFVIEASRGAGVPDTQISPDSATCSDCLSELRDPADRRYRHPFINCTNCGPRFTIVTGIPYDRRMTTMAGFEMCQACRAEYDDPGDRRFHAQPNACPDCGPVVRLLDRDGAPAPEGGIDEVAATGRALLAGLVVAVKGIGGYHLACRADSEPAVATLRTRKRREDKPFAVMTRDLESAASLVEVGAAERTLLTGRERPIVIARRRPGAAVAASVAPGSPDLGVMLPYSPLHHLLAADTGVDLVMTSGNVSDEPIAYEDEDARARLGPIADRFCVHDRPIHSRTDDSVVRAVEDDVRSEPLILRRSRGWVPGALGMPIEPPQPVLACGAELKSAFCLARGRRAWVSHHLGDLKNFETLTSFRRGIEHFEDVLEVEPGIVAHDMHPDYLSTAYALERAGVERIAVQHHHAHLAAVLAEHGLRGPAVGAIYDGVGYGADGTAWGGELLIGGLGSYERAGLLFPVRLPGGDKAAEQPWRMACSWLAAAFDGAPERAPEPLAGLVEPGDWEAVAGICRTGLAAPLTTSAGRLFDAVAALCGLRAEIHYEGQAAIELEALASSGPADPRPYPMPLLDGRPGPMVIDARPTIRAIAADLEREPAAAPVVAARFHVTIAAATAEAAGRLAERRGLGDVVLSGGVFQNRLLLQGVVPALAARGLRPLLPLRLPANDGGIAYGQAAIAAHAEASRSEGQAVR
jgi:hydrogenase maturation protein HypF